MDARLIHRAKHFSDRRTATTVLEHGVGAAAGCMCCARLAGRILIRRRARHNCGRSSTSWAMGVRLGTQGLSTLLSHSSLPMAADHVWFRLAVSTVFECRQTHISRASNQSRHRRVPMENIVERTAMMTDCDGPHQAISVILTSLRFSNTFATNMCKCHRHRWTEDNILR